MRVREPSSLRLAREFPKAALRLASEQDNALNILGQSLQSGTKLFFADFSNRRVKVLDLQTGALELTFEERDLDWYVSNSRLLDTRLADMLVVTETKQDDKVMDKEKRVVIAKRNTDGIYLTDHVLKLDEATSVCLSHPRFTLGEACWHIVSDHDRSLDLSPHCALNISPSITPMSVSFHWPRGGGHLATTGLPLAL